MHPAHVLLTNLVLISCVSATGIAAQRSPRGGSPDTTLARLIAGQARIRVRLGSGSLVELRRPGIEGSTLVGQAGAYGGRTEYPVQDLNQVWRRGSAVGMGFAIGAGIGFAGGAAMGIAVANICVFSCEVSGSEQIKAALAGGFLGGMAAGLVGALIAAPAERWKSVYKSQAPRVTPLITRQGVGVSLTF